MTAQDNQYTPQEVTEHIAEAQELLAFGNDAQELGKDFGGYFAGAIAHLIEAIKGQQQEIQRLSHPE